MRRRISQLIERFEKLENLRQPILGYVSRALCGLSHVGGYSVFARRVASLKIRQLGEQWSDLDDCHGKELHFSPIDRICSLEHERAK